jgi:hypothetical protein
LADKGPELLHLGLTRRAFRLGREGALLRRLASGVDELLEACGREDEQQPSRTRVDGVAVRDVLGAEEERTRRSLYRLIADLERQLSLENPESLVLAMMRMEGSLTLWVEHLNQRVAPARLFSCGLDGGQAAEPPSRLSLAFLELEDPRGAILFVHLLLLSLPRLRLFPLGLMTQ